MQSTELGQLFGYSQEPKGMLNMYCGPRQDHYEWRQLPQVTWRFLYHQEAQNVIEFLYSEQCQKCIHIPVQ
uniref:Uncharacterized protein n=1 Tax=Arundo donax TaxID=35708 RepID=A0A0A9CHW9_ARUDO